METTTQPATRMNVAEAAKYFQRTQRCIQLWCENGTLLAFNYQVIRERCGRWIILIPIQ